MIRIGRREKQSKVNGYKSVEIVGRTIKLASTRVRFNYF